MGRWRVFFAIWAVAFFLFLFAVCAGVVSVFFAVWARGVFFCCLGGGGDFFLFGCCLGREREFTHLPVCLARLQATQPQKRPNSKKNTGSTPLMENHMEKKMENEMETP